MKNLYFVICLIALSTSVLGQGQIFTISNMPNSNVTGATPFQPIIPSMDANLNIATLIAELSIQNVVINEAAFFSFETAILEDVFYSTPFDLSITSNNNVLGYADLKNDSTGNINLFGLTNVVIGTELSWLPVYGLSPLPVFPPILGVRNVEIGSLQGNTVVDAGTYAALVSPVPGGMPTQLGRSKGSLSANITVLAGNYILIQAGGPDSYAMVGFGGPTIVGDVDVDIFMNVEEGNIWVTGGADSAFAQIGNRHAGSFLMDGDITVIARSVPVNVPANGNTILQGGAGVASEARIGNVHASTDLANDVLGRIAAVDSSSVVLRAGPGLDANAVIGHSSTVVDFTGVHDPIFVEGKLTGVLLDAISMTGADPAHCHIGHHSNANFANCYDDIYIETHGSITCMAGIGISQFTRIGHLAIPNSNGDVAGHIELNCGDSIALIANTGMNNHAHVGHAVDPAAGAGIARGNILIRSGSRQLYTAMFSDHVESSVQVGHTSPLFFDNVTLIAFRNIDLESSATPAGQGEARIVAWDTIHVVSADSIHIQSNLAQSTLEAQSVGATVWLDAGLDISFESTMGIPSAILAMDALTIRCRAADDIRLTQDFLETNLPNGSIWIESDKHYDPDSLFAPQVVRGGLSNPFPPGTLSGGSMLILSDLLGVIKFENAGQQTTLSTMDGNIDIRSRSTSVDGNVTNLMISEIMPMSANPMTQNGKIFIGMAEQAGALIDLGDSYHDGVIQQWNPVNNGELFFNINHDIDVFDSNLQMKSVLLKTN